MPRSPLTRCTSTKSPPTTLPAVQGARQRRRQLGWPAGNCRITFVYSGFRSWVRRVYLAQFAKGAHVVRNVVSASFGIVPYVIKNEKHAISHRTRNETCTKDRIATGAGGTANSHKKRPQSRCFANVSDFYRMPGGLCTVTKCEKQHQMPRQMLTRALLGGGGRLNAPPQVFRG